MKIGLRTLIRDISYIMRFENIRRYLPFDFELYKENTHYDIVIFQKAMLMEDQILAKNLKEKGVKIIFDANVNYYEINGEYISAGSKPTLEQREAAIYMTRLADYVIADSIYIRDKAKKYNKNVIYIPDNIDFDHFKYVKEHKYKKPIRLMWSGYALKSVHLLLIKEVLEKLSLKRDIILYIISEKGTYYKEEIRRINCPVEWVEYNYNTFPQDLLKGDIIISPRYLCNEYDKGHTSLKILVGMALYIPPVASPQPSYVEILDGTNGFIVETQEEWEEFLSRLIDSPDLRNEVGFRSRKTALKFSSEKIAKKYKKLFEDLLSQ